MKIERSLLGILILLLLFIPEVKSQEEEPYLEITSPNINTVWYAGERGKVVWETNIIADTVSLAFWGGNYYLDEDVDNKGYYYIPLPEDITLGRDFMIEMSIFGDSGNDSDMVWDILIKIRPPVDYTIWIILAVVLGLIGIFGIMFYAGKQNRLMKKEIEILKRNEHDRTENEKLQLKKK